MPLETVTYISDLVQTNPTSTDPKKQGDDHIRNIKSALRATFPNINAPVTVTANQLNGLTRVIVSVSDYASAQACITANPGTAIFFPTGAYAPVTVTTDNTRLYGTGRGSSYILSTGLTDDAVTFTPNNTTTTTTFLNSCSIEGLTIYSSANKTAGAGIRLTQCNSFTLRDCEIKNHPRGLRVDGGQLNIISGLSVSAASSVLTGTPVASSSLISLAAAPIDGGLYQPCYTIQIDDFNLACSKCIDAAILVNDCDGATFSNGYVAYAYNDNVKVLCNVASRFVAGLTFDHIYFDGVSMTTGTVNGINIAASTGTVYSITVNNCQIANYTGKGLIVADDMYQLTVTGGSRFTNIASWAIDATGDNTKTEMLITGNQFRDVGEVTVTTGGIQASAMLNCTITDNQFSGIGNTGATAVKLSGANVNGCVLQNLYTGCTTNETNGATWSGVLQGLPATFTPVLTFATPGTLSLGAYSNQLGRYTRIGRMVHAYIDIQVVVTTGTASGDLRITGLPYTSANVVAVWYGSMRANGITKAGYSQFTPRIDANSSLLNFSATGSGAGVSTVAAADVPSGGTVILGLEICYEAAG